MNSHNGDKQCVLLHGLIFGELLKEIDGLLGVHTGLMYTLSPHVLSAHALSGHSSN